MRFLIEMRKKKKETSGEVLCFCIFRNDPMGWCTAWFNTSGSRVNDQEHKHNNIYFSYTIFHKRERKDFKD